jgi:hypothetical protein
MKTKIRFLQMLQSVIKRSMPITIDTAKEKLRIMCSNQRKLSVLIARLSLMLKSL